MLTISPASIAATIIPDLDWQPRSDWVNVKLSQPAAVGDGLVDDTKAIQSALDSNSNGRTIYLPPGNYRLTRTLMFRGPREGCALFGHGAATTLIWDGPVGGVMFRSDGIAYCRYVGLSWDGRNRAAVGFEHAATTRFETEVTHQHEVFRNFTAFGVRVGHAQRVASAEILYQNCLFENCGTALGLLTFNDYNHTLDRCEIRDCGFGVVSHKSNFYARNSHFERSRDADFLIEAEHGCSIRRCTSVGSRRFILERGTIAPLTIQDCHVADWTDSDAAVVLNGSPVLILDSTFTSPASASATSGGGASVPVSRHPSEGNRARLDSSLAPPTADGGAATHPRPIIPEKVWDEVELVPPKKGEGRPGERSRPNRSANIPILCASGSQKVLLSNNQPGAIEQLIRDTASTNIYVIPAKGQGGVITNSSRSFLASTARVGGRIYDAVRDFGAKGDGKADDTDAIQSAIAAACRHGHGAIAYLPTGRYGVARTLTVTGSDYTLAGSGFACGLVWHGEAGRPFLHVTNVQDVTLSGFMIGHHDLGPMTHGDDILVQASANLPFSLVLDEVYAFGMYQKSPDQHGIHFDRLGPECFVNVRHVQGNLRITDSSAARLLFRTSYEGTVTISGSTVPRGGIIGFLTRVSTVSAPALRVLDNQSAVFSDFYSEQSGQVFELRGDASLPGGALTVQSPKIHARTNVTILESHGYSGRVYLGQSQFYCEPANTVFNFSAGAAPRLFLAGNVWYHNHLRLPTNSTPEVTLIGNLGAADTSLTVSTFDDVSAALDDLRALGRLDLELPW